MCESDEEVSGAVVQEAPAEGSAVRKIRTYDMSIHYDTHYSVLETGDIQPRHNNRHHVCGSLDTMLPIALFRYFIYQRQDNGSLKYRGRNGNKTSAQSTSTNPSHLNRIHILGTHAHLYILASKFMCIELSIIRFRHAEAMKNLLEKFSGQNAMDVK